MNRLLVVLIIIFASTCSSIGNAQTEKRVFSVDENVWVLFYDVPSRRFRQSRDAFVRRDWDTVRSNLSASAGFIRTEATRAVDDLVHPMENLADRLDVIADDVASKQIRGSDLDTVFARAHWLLAQHYLELAAGARDVGDGRTAGSYLWATAHHMERTVLWSDARMSRAQIRSLDRLRDIADRLRDSADPASILKEKPVLLARKTLADLGAFMDRKIWVGSP